MGGPCGQRRWSVWANRSGPAGPIWPRAGPRLESSVRSALTWCSTANWHRANTPASVRGQCEERRRSGSHPDSGPRPPRGPLQPASHHAAPEVAVPGRGDRILGGQLLRDKIAAGTTWSLGSRRGLAASVPAVSRVASIDAGPRPAPEAVPKYGVQAQRLGPVSAHTRGAVDALPAWPTSARVRRLAVCHPRRPSWLHAAEDHGHACSVLSPHQCDAGSRVPVRTPLPAAQRGDELRQPSARRDTPTAPVFPAQSLYVSR